MSAAQKYLFTQSEHKFWHQIEKGIFRKMKNMARSTEQVQIDIDSMQ